MEPSFLPTTIPFTPKAKPAVVSSYAFDGYWARKDPWLDGSTVLDQRTGLGTPRPPEPRRCLEFNGTDQYGWIPIDPVTEFPFTVFGWARVSAVGVDNLCGISASSSSVMYFNLRVDEGDRVGVSRRNTTEFVSDISMPLLENQWISYVAVFTSATSATLYRNGILASELLGLDAVNVGSSFNRFHLACRAEAGPTVYLEGKAMHCGFLRRAATLADVQVFHQTGIIPDAEVLLPLDGNSTTVAHNIGTSNATYPEATIVNGAAGMLYEGRDVPFSRQNEVGFTEDGDVKVPLLLSNLSIDANGNPAQYTGKAHFDGKLEQSHCLTFDGVDDYISVPSLTGSETIVSSGGTSTLSIVAGRINGTAGTAWNIVISNGMVFPCAEGSGAFIHDVVGNQAYPIINGQASNWETTQNDYHYNLVNGFNLFELPLVPALSLSSSSQAVDQSGGTYSFQVLSNTDWSWSSDSPWVSSSEAVNQNGDQEFTYTVQENESAERTAIITVTTGGITVTHTITQTAGFLLLDNYTADFGYSLRKIRVGYTGPAIRVRRESDDAEQDIGFVGNDLDVGAIETFCSGTVGRVTTWYDQAGVKNATSANATTQPFIYVDGAVTRNEHGLPAIWIFDENPSGITNALYTPSWGLAESLWMAASAVYSLVEYGEAQPVLYGNNMRMMHAASTGQPRLQVIKVIGGSYFFGSGTPLEKNTTYVRLDSYDRVTASIFFDKETVAASSRADIDDDAQVNVARIGQSTVGNVLTYMLLSELVTFTVEDSANSLAIRSDQYDYWTNGTDPTILSVSDPSETFTEFAGTHSFNVTADATWSWSCDADWITSDEFANQTGNKEFTYSVSTNEGAERTATITFTSGGLTATHTVTQATAPPLLLDNYTGAVGFSLRKIRLGYTGPCIRVRRASDNSEQDIGFVAGELDTDTIETFCAGTVGRVTTWYDQVGSNNAVQTNTTLQPIIYESGAIPVNEYGRPAIRCLDNNPSGSTGRVTLPAFFTVDQPYVAYASVYSLLDSGNFPPIVASAPVERGLTVAHDGTTRIPIATAIRTSGSRSAGSGGTPVDLNTTTIRFDYADRTLVQIFLNTDIEDSGSAGADADVDFTALNPIDLGGRNATIVLNDTLLSEVIGFTVNQTANNLAIRTDQYNYWTTGITPTVLSISDPSEAFTEFAGTHSFNVTADATWSWSCDADWVNITELLNQTGNQVFEYSVPDNTGEERTATITFTSGGLTATHTVTQAAMPLLLDSYTGAVGFSLRKIRTAYTGPAIRVRRESDNAEQDIGFDGNDLDTAAIETFCSGTTGYVTTWYDQVGSNDAVKAVFATTGPVIYESGAVVVNEHGLPAIRFFDDDSGAVETCLRCSAWAVADAAWLAQSMVYSLKSLGSSPTIFYGTPLRSDHFNDTGRLRIIVQRTGGSVGSQTAAGLSVDTTTIRMDSADRTNVQIFLDTESSAELSIADRDEDASIGVSDIGNRALGAILSDTLMSELIGFTADESANNLAIRTEQYNYWKAVV